MHNIQPINVDAIIIDDDKRLVELLVDYAFRNKSTHLVSNPRAFLTTAHQYNKKAAVFIDYNFDDTINGIEIAIQLHSLGFKQLYLLTGEFIDEKMMPDYLTLIFKGDFHIVKQIANEL